MDAAGNRENYGEAKPEPNIKPQLKIKTVNLKADMPSVQRALQMLEREILLAGQQKTSLLKFVHGYGSTGAGGDIRIAVQRRLRELAEGGEILACIFGENWAKSDEVTWRCFESIPA